MTAIEAEKKAKLDRFNELAMNYSDETADEMAKLQATVKLRRLTFLGPLNDEIESMASGIDVPIVRCDTLAAGFARTP